MAVTTVSQGTNLDIQKYSENETASALGTKSYRYFIHSKKRSKIPGNSPIQLLLGVKILHHILEERLSIETRQNRLILPYSVLVSRVHILRHRPLITE